MSNRNLLVMFKACDIGGELTHFERDVKEERVEEVCKGQEDHGTL